MKIKELMPGLNVYVNNEEADFLRKFEDTPEMQKMHIDDRQLVLANQLVNKGLLKRIKQNGRLIFKRTTR